MKNRPKVGLWIPRRLNINESITVDNPAHIESSICTMLLNYLGMVQKVEVAR